MTNNIILIGAMGAGKTAIGKQVAKQLSWQFCDVDHRIEEIAGVDIPWIFEKEGEAGFRQRETAALKASLQQQQMVIATGGGIIKSPENRHLLRTNGYIIYLYSSPAEQLKRVAHDVNRPLANTADPALALALLTQQRQNHYLALAQQRYCTDGCEAVAVAKTIYNNIKIHVTS